MFVADLRSPGRSLIYLGGTPGKKIKAIAQKIGLSHAATSRHLDELRRVGVVEIVLIDQDDLRAHYQRLSIGKLATDENGREWWDFGAAKV